MAPASTPLPVVSPRGSSTDVARDSVAAVYARAFLGAISGKGDAESLLRELGGFVIDVLEKNPAIAHVFGSPRIAPTDIAALLDRTVRGKLSSELVRFFHVLNQHSRLGYLREIYVAARKMWNEQQGVIEVHVTTAHPLDAAQAGKIREALAAKLKGPVELQAQVDPSIVGGIQIRIGDTVFDASVTQQLRMLREEALNSAVAKIRTNRERYAVDSAG